MVRTGEKLVFVLARRSHECAESRVDVDMAGGAGAHAAADREQFVEPGLFDILHHRPAAQAIDDGLAPVP